MTKLIKILVSISLSLLILFGSFYYVMDWKSFYTYEIEKNNITEAVGIPEEELLPLYMVLTDYMLGRVESIQMQATVDGLVMPMYNQREIDHMVDVKHLMTLLRNLVTFLFAIIALGVFMLARKSERFKGIFIGQFITTIGVFLGFIAMAMTDFNKYFFKFHELFFTNDLWLLNPETDRMIMLLPEMFFRDIVIVIVLAYALMSILVGVVGVSYARHSERH